MAIKSQNTALIIMTFWKRHLWKILMILHLRMRWENFIFTQLLHYWKRQCCWWPKMSTCFSCSVPLLDLFSNRKIFPLVSLRARLTLQQMWEKWLPSHKNEHLQHSYSRSTTNNSSYFHFSNFYLLSLVTFHSNSRQISKQKNDAAPRVLLFTIYLRAKN